jgi:hypothetical protein
MVSTVNEGCELLKEGDIVRVYRNGNNPSGVVVEIGEYGQVYIFWPGTGKISHSGKKWAEMNLELIEDCH